MNSMFSENSVRVQADSSTEMAEVEARYSQEEKEIYTVLMTTVLWHSLKSARLILPVPFFFLKIVLAIRGYKQLMQLNSRRIHDPIIKWAK